MREVTVRTMGGQRVKLEVDEGPQQVGALRQRACRGLGLAEGRARLVYRGMKLEDDGEVALEDGDTLIAVAAPKAPVVHKNDHDSDGEDEEDELRFKVEGLSPMGRVAARFLQHKVGVPEPVMVLLFSVSLRTWVVTVGLMAGGPVASRYGWGPPYIILAMMFFMVYNLGRRAEGDASAYSVFNEGFRALPGQLNAEDMDNAIRHGRGM